jgi:hypothetical protein
MSTTTNRWTGQLHRVLVGLPVLSLVLAALAWLRYGIDLPWIDDWRGYAEGTIDSLAPAYLFRAMNDTMSPVGKALDALVQRTLDGNAVAYQFLSMVTVLGSLLILQWKLLELSLGNKRRAAVCFVFTLLMLQPGSYWGLENLAYQQGLPLVFILWALLILSRPSPSASPWRGPSVALLALLAGFTYISGAFAALAAGLTLLGVAGLCQAGERRRQQVRAAAWFASAAAVAVAVQFYFSVFHLRATSVRLPLALPSQPQFWAYYLGKVARSLLLPPDWPRTSLAVTALGCVVAIVCAAVLLRRASAPAGTDEEKRLAAIYLPMAALVTVYLMLIAAGRANLRPPEMQRLLEIFALGFPRFHFFWATLIWPWVVATLVVLASRALRFRRAEARWAVVIGFGAPALVVAGGGFDHMVAQRELAQGRERVAHCLLRQLQKGGGIHCEALLAPRFILEDTKIVITERAPDAYPAYLYAREIGASFVRNFPILPLSGRRESIVPFYRFEGDAAKPRTYELDFLGKGRFRAVGADPRLYVQTGRPEITRRCTVMDVEVAMKLPQADTVQLFYAPAGDSEEYSEQNSVKASVGPSGTSFQTVGFRIESETGFFETLRLDPGTRPQLLEIGEVRLYCVRALPETRKWAR